MSKTKGITISLLFLLLIASAPLALAENNGLMFDVHTKPLVGSTDSVVMVQVTEYLFPVTKDFNVSSLVVEDYNGTKPLEESVYIFYINSSGAYLLYAGDGNGNPSAVYDDNLKTWYFGFDFGESNLLLKAFLHSLGYDVNWSELKNPYLAFNGSCLWNVSKRGVKGRNWSITAEAVRNGGSFLANFTVSYVDPAHGASWADYSWRIPAGEITKLLGNLTSISVASQRLINCTKGKMGEDYCFPIDNLEAVYVYPADLKIVMFPEKGRMRYVVIHERGNGKPEVISDSINPLRKPEYVIFRYDLRNNTTLVFPLLQFRFPSSEMNGSVGTFTIPPCREESHRVHGSANNLIVALVGVGIGLAIGVLLGRRRR